MADQNELVERLYDEQEQYAFKVDFPRLYGVNSLGNKTPFEIVFKKQPDVSHIRPIGSKAYCLLKGSEAPPKLQKLSARAAVGYLIGYEGANKFRIWNPIKNVVIITRDVTFDESSEYDPKISQSDPHLIHDESILKSIDFLALQDPASKQVNSEIYNEEFFNWENIYTVGNSEVSNRKIRDVQDTARKDKCDLSSINTSDAFEDTHLIPQSQEIYQINDDFQPSTPNDRITGQEPSDMSSSSSLSTLSERQSEEYEEVPNIHTVATRSNEISADIDENNILSDNEQRPRKAPRRDIYALAGTYETFYTAMTAAVNNPENLGRKSPFISTLKPPPQTWKQMIRHSESNGFIKAAKIEWQTLGDKETFDIIIDERALELQRIHQINSLPLKWVFTYKQDKGRLSKHKARIFVRGDLHRTTRDTFAATLAVSTFRALMSLVAAFNMEVISLDAVNAFLNSKLDEAVVCEFPPGYEIVGYKILLKRALYRLPRSSLLCAQTVEKELKDLGFEKVQGVDCLMFDGKIYCFYFVDDFMAISLPEHSKKLNMFKEKLMKTFQMRECEPDRFLGISIIRNRLEKKVWILQDIYITNMATKYQLDHVTKTPTPLPTSYDKSPDSERTNSYKAAPVGNSARRVSDIGTSRSIRRLSLVGRIWYKG
ncbi:hypothetical protein K3495_g14086 [Podosphaera aphanis]|nr:hypothetical protein K3495_g14086 [Podosphaera aphanis]